MSNMGFSLLWILLTVTIGLDAGTTGNAPVVAMFKAAWGGIQPADGVDECGLQCLTTPGCKTFAIHEQLEEQCQLHNNQTLTELATYNSSNLWVKPREVVCGIFEQQCYMVVVTNSSWYEARDFCEVKHSYLADVPDSTERNAVWRYAKDLGDHVDDLWVGVVQQDPAQSGQTRDYKWLRCGINASEAFGARFVSSGTTAACGMIRPDRSTSRLADIDCAIMNRGFICEW